MGGRISVESEVGQGSTFRFTARFALPDIVRRPEPRRSTWSCSAICRVLVVDDNATNRRILA